MEITGFFLFFLHLQQNLIFIYVKHDKYSVFELIRHTQINNTKVTETQ